MAYLGMILFPSISLFLLKSCSCFRLHGLPLLSIFPVPFPPYPSGARFYFHVYAISLMKSSLCPRFPSLLLYPEPISVLASQVGPSVLLFVSFPSIITSSRSSTPTLCHIFYVPTFASCVLYTFCVSLQSALAFLLFFTIPSSLIPYLSNSFAGSRRTPNVHSFLRVICLPPKKNVLR